MAGKLSKRQSTAILNALSGGNVPRRGVEHIVVGREAEMEALLHDLDDIIADGGATCRLIVGRYGAGKSFMLQLLRNFAFQRNFVVVDADLSQQHRLTGSKGEGLALYRQLTANMATKTRPLGKAFPALLEKWISKVQSGIVRAGIRRDSRRFADAVESSIYAVVDEMEDMVHGSDFAKVIHSYWKGHQDGNEDLKSAAMRWLRGEYSVKTEAWRALGVRVIIDDKTWYDYLKLMARFVHEIGYRGLIVFIDEAAQLYSIPHPVSRENNYARLQQIYDDTRQGGAEHLGVFIGATPEMVRDTRRGLFSYEALRTRLEDSRFVHRGLRDMNAPVIQLDMLDKAEITALLQKLCQIHGFHYKYAVALEARHMDAFMDEVGNRIGAEAQMTPREIVREFVTILNLLRQNPDRSFESLLNGADFQPDQAALEAEDSPYADFDV